MKTRLLFANSSNRRIGLMALIFFLPIIFARLAFSQTPSTQSAGAGAKPASALQADFNSISKRWTNTPLSELKTAAESGDPTAQSYLAERLMLGIGIGQNRVEGVSWYRKAAEQGLAFAQCRLGWALETGAGAPANRELAMEWTRKAAEQGDTQAELNLGWMYAFENVAPGQTVTGNYPVAAEWYEKAARKGNPYAQFQLAELYIEGKLGDSDRSKCVEWFLKAAQQGHTAAQSKVGELPRYFPNHPLLQSTNALLMLTMAAEKGDLRAQWELARRHRVGDGVRKDSSEAFRWMKRAAENNAQNTLVSDAMCELANMYENGEGVAKNLAAAWPLYLSAAGESANAQFRVGRMYEEGTGVEKDDRAAAEFYFIAATRGFGTHVDEAPERLFSLYAAGRGLPVSKSDLESQLKRFRYAPTGLTHFLEGEIYWKGKIVEQDKSIAVDHFTRAAKLGSAEAKNRLGQLWAAGLQGQPDLKEAASWYRKAAEQGLAEAQFNLGLCCAKGEGVATNVVESWKWLTLAEGQKYPVAETERQKVESQLTPEELKEARSQAARFKPVAPTARKP